MCIGTLTVLNMLIGVICDIVTSTKQTEKDKLLVEKCMDVFDEIDDDGNGSLSRQEFRDSAHILRKVGLDMGVSGAAFDLLDVDGDGELEIYEFLDMILKVLHPPQTTDVLMIK